MQQEFKLHTFANNMIMFSIHHEFKLPIFAGEQNIVCNTACVQTVHRPIH